MPDGKRFQHREWVLYYCSLQGAVLSFWQVPDDMLLLMDGNGSGAGSGGGVGRTFTEHDVETVQHRAIPSFIQITDATVEWVGVYPKGTFIRSQAVVRGWF